MFHQIVTQNRPAALDWARVNLGLLVARGNRDRPDVGGTLSKRLAAEAVSPPQKHSFQHLPHISSIPGHPTQHIIIVLIPAAGTSNSITHTSQHTAYTHTPGLSAHHVGAGRPELRQRQPQEQCQRQVLCNNARRQLQQTKHPRIRWHRKHHCLQQRAHKHHGASGVQQEIRGGRRWWMWQDVSPDQLQPGRVPRGECRLMEGVR